MHADLRFNAFTNKGASRRQKTQPLSLFPFSIPQKTPHFPGNAIIGAASHRCPRKHQCPMAAFTRQDVAEWLQAWSEGESLSREDMIPVFPG
jgi:hypothetical protein